MEAKERARDDDDDGGGKIERLKKGLERYASLRADAEKARWELLIQRQACGFNTSAHSVVESNFPIPKRLCLQDLMELEVEGGGKALDDEPEKPAHNFVGQKDWWDRKFGLK